MIPAKDRTGLLVGLILGLWGGFFPSALAFDSPSFLPADQAFVVGADYAGADRLELFWNMPDGYYLYRQRFAVLDNSKELLSGIDFPAGLSKEDEWFGLVEVYYRELLLSVPVTLGLKGKQDWMLRYQGCADAGLCYPPQYYKINFSAGKSGVSLAQVVEASGSIWGDAAPLVPDILARPSNTASDLAGLLGQGSLTWALLLLFLAGIGLTFTPCVLPMVPILSSIIIGDHRPASRNAMLLSSAYVLGMATTYAIAGGLTGLFGAYISLQAALQSPWVLMAVSALFILLALSSFGVYEIRLPARWQNWLSGSTQASTGRVGGVALMGGASALLVSPCISAPLAGVLIYISTWQDVGVGAIALFVLALGMGMPLLLLGFGAGRLLPSAGSWMQAIKTISGFGLLALAVWLLSRLASPQIELMLWALLAIGFALWLFFRANGWLWLRRTLGALVMVYGLILMASGVGGGKSLWGFFPFGEASSSAFHFRLAGDEDIAALLAERTLEDRPTMLYFSADWCIICTRFERSIFPRPEIAEQLDQMLVLKVDLTPNKAMHRRWLEAFNLFGPPAMLFFDRAGGEVKHYRWQGEISAGSLVSHIQQFLQEQTPQPTNAVSLKARSSSSRSGN